MDGKRNMERLTTRNSMGVVVLKTPYQCERCGNVIYRLADYGNGEPIEKLARYEELQEQGSMAGTALRTLMSKLESNTNNELGIELYNADGSARALADVINDLQVTRNLTTEEKGNMERLTKRSKNGTGVYNTPSGDPVKWEDNRHKVLQKLAEYEDLEEQCIKENSWGLKMLLHKWKEFFEDIKELYEYKKLGEQGKLPRLPCAVGNMVYRPDKYLHRVRNHIIEKIEIDSDGIWAIDTSGNIYYPDDFGRTIFLTENQAEAALKEMQKG